MGDPFALINRSMNRNVAAGKGGYPVPGYPGGRAKRVDIKNPKDIEYLRRMHPDFDEVMGSADIDYRTRCVTDADFASKFRIPPVIDPMHTFRGHTNSVDAVCWGPDAGSFVTASHDSTLKVWDARRGNCLATLAEHVAGVYHCTVAANKRFILSCGSGDVKNVLLWAWPDKKVAASWKGHRRSVMHADIAADSATAATADQEGTVIVHDVQTGKATLRACPHLGVVHGGKFCRTDSNLLCTAGADGLMHVLDIREQRKPQAWSLASAVANSVFTKASLELPKAHDGYAVHAVEFVDPTTIYSGGADNKMKRWDLRAAGASSPTCVGQYLGHTGAVRSLAVAPSQKFAVTGCEDGSLRVWLRDPLGDLRATVRDLKAKANEIEVQLKDGGAMQQELTKRLSDTKDKMAHAKAVQDREARNGYAQAAQLLNGHAALVSGCAWQESADGKLAQILSSSWDQTMALFNVPLEGLA